MVVSARLSPVLQALLAESNHQHLCHHINHQDIWIQLQTLNNCSVFAQHIHRCLAKSDPKLMQFCNTSKATDF